MTNRRSSSKVTRWARGVDGKLRGEIMRPTWRFWSIYSPTGEKYSNGVAVMVRGKDGSITRRYVPQDSANGREQIRFNRQLKRSLGVATRREMRAELRRRRKQDRRTRTKGD